MVPPAVFVSGQCPHDLDRLDPLFAKTLHVEGARRMLEIRIRKKCLHGDSVPRCAIVQPT
jgi:hypothetical protein